MICAYSSFSSGSSASSRMLEKPTMAFRGVRISWLILARKADFKRLLSSARSLASSNSSSIFLRWVIATDEPIKVSGVPSSSRISTAACASTHSKLVCPLADTNTRYSSFIVSMRPSSNAINAFSTLSRSSLWILEKYSASGTDSASSSPLKSCNSIGRFTSQRIVFFFKSHFHGIKLATSSVIANLWFTDSSMFCARWTLVTSITYKHTSFSSAPGTTFSS